MQNKKEKKIKKLLEKRLETKGLMKKKDLKELKKLREKDKKD